MTWFCPIVARWGAFIYKNVSDLDVTIGLPGNMNFGGEISFIRLNSCPSDYTVETIIDKKNSFSACKTIKKKILIYKSIT